MTERILTVIPCLNEEAHLKKLVHQLEVMSASLPMRIVIADGGSTDRTEHIAAELDKQFSNVIVLQNSKRLQSAALNLAVSTFGKDAEFLIRIDAHAEYPDDYCKTLVDEAEKTGASSVAVAMHTVGTNPFQQIVAATQNSKLGNGGAAHRQLGQDGMWVDHGHHALMRIAAFRDVGGYDESFSHNEDAELDTRLRRAGHKIWLTGKTSLTYYPRTSPLALFRQYVRHGEGRARHILKHRTMPKLRQLVPAAVLPAILLAFLTPFNSIFELPLAVWVFFCLGYGVMLAVKEKNVSLAASGPIAMIMHTGWSIGFWHAVLAALWRLV